MSIKKILTGMAALTSVVSMVFVLSSCGSKTNNEVIEDTAETVTEAVTETVETTNKPSGKKIDVSKLKNIESKDTSLVKVEDLTMIEDGAGISMGGNDALSIKIKNDEQQEVTDCEIYLIGYDSNCYSVSLKGGIKGYNASDIVTFNTENTVIAAGASETVSIRCDGENVNKINAFIGSYKTADGTVHENELTQDWINTALGGESM